MSTRAPSRSDRREAQGAARRGAARVDRSRTYQRLVRAGFFARGLTYGLVGILAFSLALGAGTDGADPSQQGALGLISRSAIGDAALVLIAAGLLAYAIWKLEQGIFERGPEGGGSSKLVDRIGNVAGGICYLGFFGVAVKALFGSAGNGSSGPRHAAGGVLGWPGGPVLVAIAGFVLIGVSIYQLVDAVRAGFAKDSKTGQMGHDERRLFLLLGRIGLSARALVFVLVGWFLVRTAIDYNASKAVGVDGALARLHSQPYGPWLVGLVGLGLIVFAAFSFFETRYRRL